VTPEPVTPAGPETEAELIARAQAGDMDAFEDLVMAHADRLFAVLLRMTGSPDEAGDLAQEVLLRAWRGIGRFRGGSSFFTWLYRIAMNEATRSRQRAARRRLDRHARDCIDCGRGIRAMRALVYAAQGLGGLAGVRAPETIFDRVRPAGEG